MDFWIPLQGRPDWRQWKLSKTELQLTEDFDLTPWQECLSHRKIPFKEGADLIRWGHSTTGTFTVNEAYQLLLNLPIQAPEPIWRTVWQPFLWPKVSLFLWLTAQNRILTWDNLLKRGFTGPSRCPLYHQNEETMEHLLNKCHYSQQVWDWGAEAMRRCQRDRGSIRNTLVNWDSFAFHNPILQRIWQLLPGFTLWAIWKERNQRIFNSKPSISSSTWERIKRFIRETILSKVWTQEDIQCKIEEEPILENWNLRQCLQSQSKVTRKRDSSPSVWTPPPLALSSSTSTEPLEGTLGQRALVPSYETMRAKSSTWLRVSWVKI